MAVFNLAGAGVIRLVAYLETLTQLSEARAFDRKTETDVEVSSLHEAAEGVVGGRLEPVHVLLRKTCVGVVTIPDLGLFI